MNYIEEKIEELRNNKLAMENEFIAGIINWYEKNKFLTKKQIKGLLSWDEETEKQNQKMADALGWYDPLL